MTDASDFMTKERERLTTALADVEKRMAELEKEATTYRRGLAAVDAYERTLNGEPQPTPSGRRPRGTRTETLLAMIGGNTQGMTRAQILTDLGVKGNKAQEGSISNALATMKKTGQLTLKDGVYKAA